MLNCTKNELLKSHYWGPSAEVTSVPCYFVNGYNFQTERHNTGKSTMNCGVCVKSSSYTDEDNDFYGIIEEIIQLTYPLILNLHIVLFKCHWVNPKDEPFILGQQAVQVYITQYPSMKRDKADWLVVAKVRARRVVDESKWTEICAYQSDEVVPVPVVGTNIQTYDLRDSNGLQVMIDNQATGTSRSQAHQTDDDNEYNDEDSFEDDETDDDEYELTPHHHRPPPPALTTAASSNHRLFPPIARKIGVLLVGLRRRDHVQGSQVAGREAPAEAVCRCPQPVDLTAMAGRGDLALALEFWASPEFRAQSAKNKVNQRPTRKQRRPSIAGFVIRWGAQAGDVLEAVGGPSETTTQLRRTSTVISSLRGPKRAAAMDVSSWRSEEGRVFGLGFEAHNTIAGPSQPNSSTAPTPSPPQLELKT
ncbi:UNVERIFIED_CONTAM: hypothetical protein Slati_3905800 [Sesamum latifolium]|uniref:DUF4216 domain-containing protein n=1 Tax=Sesamum latifolium TaxID=2727402 RepID=A0AAW2TNC1_9LAMI